MPSINCKTINEHINFDDSPFFISKNLQPWDVEPGQLRRATVSSFGFSGTNCHMVIEEFPELVRENEVENKSFLITLSAKTKASLAQKAIDLISYLDKNEVRLEDVSYTLNEGRSHFMQRCAMVVDTIEELKKTLQAVQEKRQLDNYYISGDLNKTSESNASDLRAKLLSSAFEYVEGQDLDWSTLRQSESGRKIRLPTYPFDRKRYWIETKRATREDGNVNSSFIVNKEILPGYGMFFEAIIDSSLETDLQDHLILSHTLFPGAGFIELLLEAMQKMDGNWCIEELKIERALAIDDPIQLKLMFREDNKKYKFMLCDVEENTYIQGIVSLSAPTFDQIILPDLPQSVDVDMFYNQFDTIGIFYGPTFSRIRSISKDDKRAIALIDSLPANKFCVHPAELDCAFQTIAAMVEEENSELYLPFQFKKVFFNPNAGPGAKAYIELIKKEGNALYAKIQLLDALNRVRLEIGEFGLRKTPKASLESLFTKKAKDIFAYGSWELIEPQINIQQPDPVFFRSLSQIPEIQLLLENKSSSRIVFVSKNNEPGELLGFVKCLIMEYPVANIQLIDIEKEEDLDFALSVTNEPLIACRDKKIYAWRLLPYKANDNSRPLILGAQSHLLITGGQGALGKMLVDRLRTHQVGLISIISRSKPEYPQSGIDYYQADVANKDEVIKIVQKAHQKQALTGVFHLAGVLDDGIFAEQTLERFQKVFAPKIQGALNLHEATKEISLDYFVLFSSIASSLGSPGQTNYAAANSMLDQLARTRRKQGLVGQSIQWGSWLEAGMAVDVAAEHAKRGLMGLETNAGLDALEWVMQQNEPVIQIADVQWNQPSQGSVVFPWLQEIQTGFVPQQKGTLFVLLQATAAKERQLVLKKGIERLLQTILGLDEVNSDVAILDMGMDSLMTLDLQNQLQNALGNNILLPASFLFEHDTVNAMVRFILPQLIMDEIKSEYDTSESDDNIKIDSVANELLKENNSSGSTPVISDINSRGSDSAENTLYDVEVKNIFLDGVTGVLGAYLVKELLLTTDCELYCLIRADTIETGWSRLIKHVSVYCDSALFEKESNKKRIHLILGDITKTRFNIKKSAYDKLCNEVDLVMHVAADVSLMNSYKALKAVNVDGTKHAIKLAAQTKNKYLLYVSTYAIMGNLMYTKHRPMIENDYEMGQDLSGMGYCMTKFEAEGLVRKSGREEGIKWMIVRPGNIMGDSKTGAYPLLINKKPSLFYALFKLVYESGYAPLSGQHYDISPVDYVAKSIIQLSLTHKHVYQAYHLTNPNVVRLHDIMLMMTELYPHIKPVSTEEYHELMMTNQLNPKNSKDTSLQLMMLQNNPEMIVDENSYPSSQYTYAIMEKLGVQCHPIDLELIKKLCAQCSWAK